MRAMRNLSWVAVVVVMGLASPAGADERDEQRARQELESLPSQLKPVTPDPGRNTASVRPPPWCDGVADVSFTVSSIPRMIEAGTRYSNELDPLWDAARATCKWGKEPAVQQAAAIIEQIWINKTGLREPQAVESIKLRLDKDKLEADKQRLCGALTVSDEIEGEDKAFMAARRGLFGCGDKQPLWVQTDIRIPDDVPSFLDASPGDPDELVRLAWVLKQSSYIFRERGSYFDRALVGYITDQIDFKALAPEAALKQLDAEPYKNNRWARMVVLESTGRAALAVAAIAEEVKKKASDADWRELLIGGPVRGVTGWNKEAAQHKEALQRSNEFEKKFWGPSRKAMKGCWPTLRKDFVGVAKTLEHHNVAEFKESLSAPLASLLFSRLAACAAVDGNGELATRLLRVDRDLRYSRGPRTAAFFGAFDTLETIVADRTKFPIRPQDLPRYGNRELDEQASRMTKTDMKSSFNYGSGKGIVKSVKKGAGGVAVTFSTEKHQEMGRSCVETNRILQFRADGSPLYYQKCKDTGMVTVDTTAVGITVPSEWADGIVPGAAVEFEAGFGNNAARPGLPVAVYADKSKKKLVNFYGLGL
jgi:hypothetical protein